MYWVLLILVTLGVVREANGQDLSTITGRIFDQQGQPLPLAQVEVVGTPLRAVANTSGVFVLQRVPAGEIVLRAQLIGYAVGVRQITVSGGDSLSVTIRLAQTAVSIPGTDAPFPPADLLAEAERLLLQVLEDSLVKAFVARELGVLRTSTIWVPWASAAVPFTADSALKFIVRCGRCRLSTSHTVEGGSQYVAGVPHIRIGVTSIAGETPRVTFCLDPVATGSTVMANCYGSGRGLQVSYIRVSAGRWMRET